MAIWQFEFGLVLRERVTDIHGGIPDSINEFKYFNEDASLEEVLDDSYLCNYWKGFDLFSLKEVIVKFLPVIETFDGEELVFGDRHGDCISIGVDSFYVEVDARDFKEYFLRHIIDLGSSLNCLVVIVGSGKVINCNYEDVVEEYLNSRAVRFISDPDTLFERKNK